MQQIFVTVFGLLYKLQQFELESTFFLREGVIKLRFKLKTVLLAIWNNLLWSSSTEQSYNFAADFGRGFLQLVDILNTVFNIDLLSGQLTFFTETFELLTKICTELTHSS